MIQNFVYCYTFWLPFLKIKKKIFPLAYSNVYLHILEMYFGGMC